MQHQDVTGEIPTEEGPPDRQKRSPATSAKVNRANAQKQDQARNSYRNHCADASRKRPAATFFAYDGQRCTGQVRDFGKEVEAVDLSGRSLGFFPTRSEALRALGGAK